MPLIYLFHYLLLAYDLCMLEEKPQRQSRNHQNYFSTLRITQPRAHDSVVREERRKSLRERKGHGRQRMANDGTLPRSYTVAEQVMDALCC